MLSRRVYRSFSFRQKCSDLIKKEARKVARGCKLLYNDTKFLIRKKYSISFNDQNYSIKEKKDMARTTSDLLKMLPFSVFIIIPGLELLLPPLLYVFPNMIPSTFLSKKKQEGLLEAMAEKRPIFADKLHCFLMERTKDRAAHEAFFEKIKTSPHNITRKDLLDNYDLFVKDIKFSEMDSKTLQTACRFMCLEPWTGFKTFNKLIVSPTSKLFGLLGIKVPHKWNPQRFPFYTIKRNFLVYQLRKLMETRRAEDMFLLEENLDELDTELLTTCCRERAIETQFTNYKEMRRELKDWVFHSTHPLKKGMLRNEVLIFGQIFNFLQDRIDVEEIKEETEATPADLFQESMQRILNDKNDAREVISQVDFIDSKQTAQDIEDELRIKVDEIIDERMIFENLKDQNKNKPSKINEFIDERLILESKKDEIKFQNDIVEDLIDEKLIFEETKKNGNYQDNRINK